MSQKVYTLTISYGGDASDNIEDAKTGTTQLEDMISRWEERIKEMHVNESDSVGLKGQTGQRWIRVISLEETE
ncbi:MAG: hypothetical protein ACFFDI_01040 [Promethearchaeota archaeon]